MAAAETAGQSEVAQRASELVATVSHELRTPLASVLGFVELLLARELDEDTRRRYLQTVHSEALRLTGLLDDFLDLQRIDAGRFTLSLEPFELGELLQHQVALFSAQSSSHELSLVTPDEDLITVGDRNRIGQVISNLISNAIKYSPAGGPVTVIATPGEGFARVQVSDYGLGIPAADQGHVFTKFFRVDSSDTRKIGGTGLGLALCQEIVAAHSGRIGFSTVEGAGSSFWFELPTAWAAQAAKRCARALVISDELELAAELTDELALDGIEVESAVTGAFALERALVSPPTMIWLDTDLSGELDGWQVLVRLKSNLATAAVPVIVCAAEERRAPAATLGAASFVLKPLTARAVREAVAQVLSAERTSVLVVGGDQILRRLVVETLARDGGDLREAADGLEALSMIGAQPPDALVLDLGVPGQDDFGTIEQVLERPETRGLPVVVLTGRELSARERHFLRARNAALLEKATYSGDQLRRLIHHPRFATSTLAILAMRDLTADTPRSDPFTPTSEAGRTATDATRRSATRK